MSSFPDQRLVIEPGRKENYPNVLCFLPPMTDTEKQQLPRPGRKSNDRAI